jgi:hypothetical protein
MTSYTYPTFVHVIAAWTAPDGDRYRVTVNPAPNIPFSVDWWIEDDECWGPISCDTTPEGAVHEMMTLYLQPRERT